MFQRRRPFVAFQVKVGSIDIAAVEDAFRHLLPPSPTPPDPLPAGDSNASTGDAGTSNPASQSEPAADTTHQTEMSASMEGVSLGDEEQGKTETDNALAPGLTSVAASQEGEPSLESAEDLNSTVDSFYSESTDESQQPTGGSLSAE